MRAHWAGMLWALCLLPFCGFSSAGQAILYQPDPDSPLGERNPDAPAGIDQYAFLIGDWDAEVTLQRDGQDPLVYRAKWHNHWIANGNMVMQEWRGPFSTGIELRSYAAEEDAWNGRNIYFPSPATWYANTARYADNEMVVTTIRTNASGDETITREIYFAITASSFRIRTERSGDAGRTWSAGRYSLIARRAE